MGECKVICVDIENKGRCLIASQEVSKNDILLVSKPYGTIPTSAKKDKVCEYCLNISDNMMPCRQNCHQVFYCSNDCEEKQWLQYHRYECSFFDKIDTLKKYNFNGYIIDYARIVMRVLTQRLNDILGKPVNISIDDIFSLISHCGKFTDERKNIFEAAAKILTEYVLTKLIPDLTKGNLEKLVSSIQSFLPEHADVEKYEMSMNCDQWLIEVVHTYSISHDDIHVIDIFKHLFKKIYILICMETVNGFFHGTFLFNGYSEALQLYVLGIYSSASMFSHSCSPNVNWFLVKQNEGNLQVGDVACFATKQLKKGEELSINYKGRPYDLYLRNESNIDDIIKSQKTRQQEIKNDYFFDCQCVRCANEAMGKLDESVMDLIKEFKCKQPKCQGWLIPVINKNTMSCIACETSR